MSAIGDQRYGDRMARFNRKRSPEKVSIRKSVWKSATRGTFERLEHVERPAEGF